MTAWLNNKRRRRIFAEAPETPEAIAERVRAREIQAQIMTELAEQWPSPRPEQFAEILDWQARRMRELREAA